MDIGADEIFVCERKSTARNLHFCNDPIFRYSATTFTEHISISYFWRKNGDSSYRIAKFSHSLVPSFSKKIDISHLLLDSAIYGIFEKY